jgi:hypothetical protein
VVVVAVVLVLLPIEASFWCEMSCQFGVMFGILGGNCAMTHKNDSTQPNPTQQTHQTKLNDNLLQKLTQTYNVGKQEKHLIVGKKTRQSKPKQNHPKAQENVKREESHKKKNHNHYIPLKLFFSLHFQNENKSCAICESMCLCSGVTWGRIGQLCTAGRRLGLNGITGKSPVV